MKIKLHFQLDCILAFVLKVALVSIKHSEVKIPKQPQVTVLFDQKECEFTRRSQNIVITEITLS